MYEKYVIILLMIIMPVLLNVTALFLLIVMSIKIDMDDNKYLIYSLIGIMIVIMILVWRLITWIITCIHRYIDN